MLRISFKAFPQRKGNKKLSDYAIKRVNKLFREGVRVFVRTVSDAMVSGGLDDDTGMSRSSLLPLAAQVRLKAAIASDIRGKGPSRGYEPIGGKYNPSLNKSKAAGERLGRSAYKIKFATKSSPFTELKFNIVVLQHLIYNSSIRHGYGPTQSVEKGEKAMIKYMRENADDIIPPRVFKRWVLKGTVPTESN